MAPRGAPLRIAGRAALALLLAGLPFATARAEEPEKPKAPIDFKQAKSDYDAWQKRPSLYMRHKGRVEFAQTGDVRAFRVLAKSYAKPEDPKDQVRYLLASMCGEHFRKAEHLDTWQGWRRKHARPRDAWLWYRGLDVEAELGGVTAVADVARGHGTAALRAAAIEVLIARKDPLVLEVLAAALSDLPTKGFDRMLLLESAAEALLALEAQRGSDGWKQVHGLLVQQLEAKPTLDRTRLVIARRLMRIPGALTDAQRELCLPAARARFFGLEATGSRIVYVIDMSDSMLTAITRSELKDLQKPSATASEAEKEALAKLPWYAIDTRVDAARALLQMSLRALTPDKHFCVIAFGTDARLLDATPGLRPATEKNVEKACKELDLIQRGEATRDRPNGTLAGYTNLHGGLHRAFKVRAKGLLKEEEYVDPKSFEEGADTVFLFSDGKPTWDDWPEWDIRLAKHKSGDPESGREVRDHEKGHYYGPYALASWLRDDVRRLELFRKVELHCVGLGEADPHLLRALAGMGLGTVRNIPVRAK